MSEKKNVPKLRFPEFTEPWEQRKLGEVLLLLKDGTHGTHQDVEEGSLLLSAKNIKCGEIKWDDTDRRISQDDYEKIHSTFSLQEGDILLTIVGSIGETAILRNTEGITFQRSVAFLRPKKCLIAEFLYSEIQTPRFQKELDSRKSTSAQPGIYLGDLSEIPVAFPRIISEQQKIGAYFSTLDSLITLHQRKLDHVKDLKKSMLQKMFPKKGQLYPEVRFPEFTDPWEQRKLGEVGKTYSGLSGKTKDDFGHGEAQFVTYMNVFSNSVCMPNMTEAVEIDDKQNKVLFGDVLFTTSSETPEEVGMSSVWLENTENTYLNSFCFGYRPTKEFNPYYLAYMLRSPSIREKITFLAQGISRYNISKNKMMDIEIPIPSIVEQKQIGEHFRTLDSLITLHQRELDHLKLLKKGMLQQMFV